MAQLSCSPVVSTYGSTQAPGLVPIIQVQHQKIKNLDSIFKSFLVNPQPVDDDVGCSKPILVQLVPTSANRQPPENIYSAPRLQQTYNTKNPGLAFDLAAIRFKSMIGSTVWYSNKVDSGSYYFQCLVHNAIAHAAAIQGNGVIHAGFFKLGGRGYLLPGESCTGKSTLCFFSMAVGGVAISDDMLVVGKGPEMYEACALRNHFVARQQTYSALPESLQLLCKRGNTELEEKYQLDRRDLPDRTDGSASVDAIVLPVIEKEPAVRHASAFDVRPCDKARVLRALGNSLDSTVLMPGLEAERSAVIGNQISMVTALPCFELVMRPTFLLEPLENMRKLAHEMDELLLRSGKRQGR